MSEDEVDLMERFKKIYSQGIVDVLEIWVDTETGINYMWHKAAEAGGLTPLLDESGKVVVTKDSTLKS